jgi:NAD(P)H-quinone oxidoreductase subunit 5
VQVGLIVAEIGLGLRYIALIHLLGNACLRTLQFVRAPTLLADYRTLENAIGERLPQQVGPVDRVVSKPVQSWIYRFAMERAYFDILLADYLVAPFVRLFRWCDAVERAWTGFLNAKAPTAPAESLPNVGQIEELS